MRVISLNLKDSPPLPKIKTKKIEYINSLFQLKELEGNNSILSMQI